VIITPPSGRSLVILYPFFFIGVFFGGYLSQSPSFHSAKQIPVMSSATQVRAHILSDCNIFCTLGEGEQWQGLVPLGLFLLHFTMVFCITLLSLLMTLILKHHHSNNLSYCMSSTFLWCCLLCCTR